MPPFINKYFAINTAVWRGPEGRKAQADRVTPQLPGGSSNADEFGAWKTETRQKLSQMLGPPTRKVPLQAEKRSEVRLDDIVMEKWGYTSETGSRIPAVL